MNRPAGRCRASSRASRRAEGLQANAATRIWLRILGKLTAIVLTDIEATTPVIPKAENARARAVAGKRNVRPRSRSGSLIRNRVHCRITTLTTVNSVTAATRMVVIFSSRR